MKRCPTLALSLCLLMAGTAHAGPVEKFSGLSSQASTWALQYEYGTGGFFVSNDKGAHFKLLCSSAIDTGVRDTFTLHVSDDAIYVGVFDGMWQGDKNGCGWKRVPELEDQWTGAMAGDPSDPKITYYATSAGGDKDNGLFIKTGSGQWMPLGSKAKIFINTLDVVKTSNGKRFYTTAVRSVPTGDPMMPETPHYMVRISEDDAKTWTENEIGATDQFGSKDPLTEFTLLAIDPTNPDTIVAGTTRSEGSDEIIYSTMQGKPGTWKMIGQVKELKGAAFGADGKLYYGDNDQMSPGLFRVDKLGDAPKQLNNTWKVSCLRYDADGKRLLACRDWQFGTANVEDGTFSALLDMRSAESFVDCPGDVPEVAKRCQTQLLNAYCGQAHYEYAPVCSVYDPQRPWLDRSMAPDLGGRAAAGGSGGSSAGAGAGGSTASAGATGSTAGRPASSAGTGGPGAAGTSSAGASGTSAGGAGGSTKPKDSGGCSCTAPGAGDSSTRADWSLGLVAFGWLYSARRRRRRL